MPIIAKQSEGGAFKEVPTGTHVARCVRLIDLGTQQTEWQGLKKSVHQIVLQWELPAELIETDDGPKPMLVSRFYNLSLFDKSALYKDLVAWRGRAFTPEELKGFDVSNVLGHPCLLTVVDKETGGTKVSAVGKMMKGQTCPPQVNPSVEFSLAEWDPDGFEKLPEGFKKIVMQSAEYKDLHSTHAQRRDPKTAPVDDLSDEIPF